MKRCTKCGVIHPATIEFFPPYHNRLGLKAWCRLCARDQCRSYQRSLEYRIRQICKKYKITEKRYYDLFEKQEGQCAICNEEQSDILLGVDHDHESEVVRGLLCKRCNAMLGFAQDSTEILLKGVEYLMKGE